MTFKMWLWLVCDIFKVGIFGMDKKTVLDAREKQLRREYPEEFGD